MALACLSAFSQVQQYGYSIYNLDTGQKISPLRQGRNSLLCQVTVVLDAQTRMAITRKDGENPTVYAGPKWDGLRSSEADDDGFCWWTCPELPAGKPAENSLMTTSGQRNHIGMIFPPGKYTISLNHSTLKFSVKKLAAGK